MNWDGCYRSRARIISIYFIGIKNEVADEVREYHENNLFELTDEVTEVAWELLIYYL